jgi:aminomethyltransferase
MIDFAGWSLPVRYSSDLAEHRAVRTGVGVFDLSHMGEIEVSGPGAPDALDFALVGWISRIAVGGAKYTMICTEDGGVVDDLVVYRIEETRFMVVANAGNHSVVVEALRDRCEGFPCEIVDESQATALVAVQGPASPTVATRIVDQGDRSTVAGLPYYSCAPATVTGIRMLVARTGYTGEDGFEFFCPSDRAGELWDRVVDGGKESSIVPCGLASRDVLRLEAGMPLYGHELGLDRSPFDAGLGRVVQFGTDADPRADFVGNRALRDAARRVAGFRENPRSSPDDARLLVGLVGNGRRSARAGYSVLAAGVAIGEVTSGAPSPSLECQIAMAYVHPRYTAAGTEVEVEIRGRHEGMAVSALPFYSQAK